MEGSQNEWKDKVSKALTKFFDYLGKAFSYLQEKLERTFSILKKMLSASKTNSALHQVYEEIGQLTFQAIESKKLTWDDNKIQKLVAKVNECKKDLETIEDEVNEIKVAKKND